MASLPNSDTTETSFFFNFLHEFIKFFLCIDDKAFTGLKMNYNLQAYNAGYIC